VRIPALYRRRVPSWIRNEKPMAIVRVVLCGLASVLLAAAPIVQQPVASVRPVTDTYFGTSVVDPYRWMESGGPEFDAYLHGQNAYTRSQLDPLPQRSVLIDAMKASVAASGSGAKLEFVEAVGSRTFLTRLPATGGYHALYVREDGRERLLFDPNTAAVPGEILLMAPSPDGKRVAFGIASGGSEKSILHVVDVDSAADRSENVTPFVADALNWRDDSSFYYVRYETSGDTRSTRTLLHRVGTSLDSDDTVLAAEGLQNALRLEHQEVAITAIAPRWAIAEVQDGTDSQHEEVFVAPLAAADSATTPWRKIAGTEDAISAVAATGDTLYLLTSKDAPYRKILRTTLDRPTPFAVVVPEGKTLLTGIDAHRGSLVVTDRDGTSAHVRIFDAALKERPLTLPSLSAVTIVDRYESSPRFLVDGSTFNDPRRIFAVDPTVATATDTGLTPPPTANYTAIRVTNTVAKSADGTLVPLTILWKTGVARDGNAPTVLLGYGSYGSTPYESPIPPTYLAMVNVGMVIAIAHVRGGGELGPSWYAAGKGPNKVHTIDDFLACAHRLIADHWTRPARLAALGASAGGITVGRAMTREPDLFAAVVSQVGISDALRFEQTPNGKGNIPEFGTVANAPDFHSLFAMSPYAHVTDGTAYPAFMMTTGLNDPRVAPWQVAKMEARVQAASTSGKPVLLRVDEHAGHGMGDSLDAQYAELADVFSFILWQEKATLTSPPAS
jgi:prolyl oligopeptidase